MFHLLSIVYILASILVSYFIILREKIVIIKIDLFLKLIVSSCITTFCKLYFICGYAPRINIGKESK